MKAGTLLLLRQRELHGRLHDVRRTPRHLGDSGEQVGQDMTAARSTSAGDVQSLGTDAKAEESTCRTKRTTSSRSSTATRSRSGAASEDRQRRQEAALPAYRAARARIPLFVGSERTDYWNDKVQEDICVKAQIGRYRIRGYGAARRCRTSPTSRFKQDPRGSVRAGPDVVSQGRARHDARRPLRRHADRALDAGDDRADELRRALEVDQDRARACLAPLRHLRQHRRGRPDARGAGGGQAAHLPVPLRPARLERPRHAEADGSRSTSRRARSPASAAS